MDSESINKHFLEVLTLPFLCLITTSWAKTNSLRCVCLLLCEIDTKCGFLRVKIAEWVQSLQFLFLPTLLLILYICMQRKILRKTPIYIFGYFIYHTTTCNEWKWRFVPYQPIIKSRNKARLCAFPFSSLVSFRLI